MSIVRERGGSPYHLPIEPLFSEPGELLVRQSCLLVATVPYGVLPPELRPVCRPQKIFRPDSLPIPLSLPFRVEAPLIWEKCVEIDLGAVARGFDPFLVTFGRSMSVAAGTRGRRSEPADSEVAARLEVDRDKLRAFKQKFGPVSDCGFSVVTFENGVSVNTRTRTLALAPDPNTTLDSFQATIGDAMGTLTEEGITVRLENEVAPLGRLVLARWGSNPERNELLDLLPGHYSPFRTVIDRFVWTHVSGRGNGTDSNISLSSATYFPLKGVMEIVLPRRVAA